MPMHKVFVYGTLKRGHGNNYLLKASKHLGAGHTVGKYWMPGNGPFVCKGKRVAKVRGDLYLVDDATLKRLDQLESHPRVWRRELTTVSVDDTVHKCWLYFYQHSDGYRVATNLDNAPHADGMYDWSY